MQFVETLKIGSENSTAKHKKINENLAMYIAIYIDMFLAHK